MEITYLFLYFSLTHKILFSLRALKRSTFNLIACDSCDDAQLNHTENKKKRDVPEVVHVAGLSTIHTES